MIVRHFLQWVRTAGAAERADATSALARAYLHSDLSPDDRAAAEGAMMLLLDDASPLVRGALARVLAPSGEAPAALILALANDQPDIASVVLTHSPLLVDTDLVDFIGSGEEWVQAAIARRSDVPAPVAAAIAEVGGAEACLTLADNHRAEIVPFSLDRIVARHGHLAAIREALLARPDLAASTRQALVVKLSDTLAGFVTARAWLDEGRARRIAKEACEKATVALAASSRLDEVRPLVRHLRDSGQLTTGLVLRALLSGNVLLFEEALAELSGVPLKRVSTVVHGSLGMAFRALFDRAGLPPSVFPAFRAALDTMRETGFAGHGRGAARLKRQMVERVLTQCGATSATEIEPLLTLLRRFMSEAAREEARLFCDELVAA